MHPVFPGGLLDLYEIFTFFQEVKLLLLIDM